MGHKYKREKETNRETEIDRVIEIKTKRDRGREIGAGCFYLKRL